MLEQILNKKSTVIIAILLISCIKLTVLNKTNYNFQAASLNRTNSSILENLNLD